MDIKIDEQRIQQALKFYDCHLKRCYKYHEKNREKLNERSRLYFQEIKNDPERYKKYLENKRLKYKSKMEGNEGK